jgi:hypothetical protein
MRFWLTTGLVGPKRIVRNEPHAAMICTAAAFCFLLTSCGATSHRPANEVKPSSRLAVLLNPPSPADAIPNEVTASLEASVKPEFSRADIHAARRVLADSPGWVVPAANGEICFVRLVYPLQVAGQSTTLSPIPSQICASEAEAQNGRLVETQSLATSGTHSRETKILGVAPNGVDAIDIVVSHGSSIILPVIRNAYETIAANPVAVRFIKLRDGRPITHEVPLKTFSATSPSPTAPAP